MIVRRIVITLVCLLVLAGCSNPLGHKGSKKSPKPAKSSLAASSELVLNGQDVNSSGKPADTAEPRLGADGKSAAPTKAQTAAAAIKTPGYVFKETVPDLNADGTLADGNDPFADDDAIAMPTPIERDPDMTKEVDAQAAALHGIDSDQWKQWLASGSPAASAQGPSEILSSMVKVWTDRCGGAKTFASGIVVGDGLVVTTVSAIESPERRIRVSPMDHQGPRVAAMIRYLDIDNDVAILYVPGLTQPAAPVIDEKAFGKLALAKTLTQRGLAIGASRGGSQGEFERNPIYVGSAELDAAQGQANGFGREITDRKEFPIAGVIDTGMAGGAVAVSVDPNMDTAWGIYGMVRTRVPYRAPGGGLAVPARVLAEDVKASEKLPQYHEFQPTGCPQWYRPYHGALIVK